MNAAPTLEQRVASALSDGDIGSNALAALIAETSTAIETAEKEAKAAREAAIDLVTSPDPVEARASMEAAAFTCERLRGALPRLQERFDTVYLDERYAAWLPRYEAIKAERDAVNAEIITTYAPFNATIVPLMLRFERIKAEASRVSAAKPRYARAADAEGCWLAAGPDDQLISAITANLKLPDAKKPSELAWPPPPPPIDYSALAAVRPHPGANWYAVNQAEAARRRTEDEKRAEELREEEGRIRNNPALWRKT